MAYEAMTAVSEAAARTRQPPQFGVRIDTNGSAGAIKYHNLATTFVAGNMVRVRAKSQALRIAVGPTNPFTPIVGTDNTAADYVWDYLVEGESIEFVVTASMPFLAVLSDTTSAGVVTIHRA